jgi:hypothetical protein
MDTLMDTPTAVQELELNGRGCISGCIHDRDHEVKVGGGGCINRYAEDKFWVSSTGDCERLRVDLGLLLPVQPTGTLLVERLRYSHTNQRNVLVVDLPAARLFSVAELGRAGFLVNRHPLSKAILVETQA